MLAFAFYKAGNPKRIKDFSGNSLHKVKSDKADDVNIGRCGLHSWQTLRPYGLMDELHSQLKTMNRQFRFYSILKSA